MTSTVDLVSRSPVGSSSRMIAGELARDLAIALDMAICTLFVARLLKVHSEGARLSLTILPSSAA